MPESPAEPLSSTLIGDAGPLTVFLHGLFGQGKNFTTVAKALAPEHSSLLIDLPNHGGSAWTESVDYAQMAGAVAGSIQESGRAPAAVVGHSMGGKVAMVLALQHPELVERLVVVDISPVPTSGMSQFEELLGALAELDLTAIGSRAEADQLLRRRVPEDSVRGFLLQNLRHRDGRWVWRANLDLLRASLGSIGEFPAGLADRPYDGPVLWIAGGDSPYIREEHTEPMRELFPRVRKVTIKGAGHWVHSEQQAVFIEVLRRFLDAPLPDDARSGSNRSDS